MTLSSFGQNHWSKGYLLQDAFAGFFDLETKYNSFTGEVIIAGVYRDSTGYDRIMVAGLDTAGNELWAKSSITPTFSNHVDLIVHPTTGEIFVVRSRATKAFLLKFGPNGSHLLSKELTFQGNRVSSKLHFLSDQSIVLVSNESGTSAKAHLLHLDQNLSLLNAYEFSTQLSSGGTGSFEDVTFLEQDKKYYLIGQGNMEVKVLVLDKAFTIQNAHSFTSPNHNFIVPQNLHATNNGIMLAATFFGADGEGVVNLDTLGLPTSMYTYSSNFELSFKFAPGSDPLKPLAVSSNSELYRLNSLGSLDFKILPNIAPINVNDARALAYNGGYAFVAMNAYNSGYHFGIQFFKENGMLPCQASYLTQGSNASSQFSTSPLNASVNLTSPAITSDNPVMGSLNILAESSCLEESLGTPDQALKLNLYPNPGQGQIKVDVNFNFNQVLVYNSTGQLMKSWSQSNLQTLDLSDLPKGLYILHFMGEETKHETRYLKQ